MSTDVGRRVRVSRLLQRNLFACVVPHLDRRVANWSRALTPRPRQKQKKNSVSAFQRFRLACVGAFNAFYEFISGRRLLAACPPHNARPPIVQGSANAACGCSRSARTGSARNGRSRKRTGSAPQWLEAGPISLPAVLSDASIAHRPMTPD